MEIWEEITGGSLDKITLEGKPRRDVFVSRGSAKTLTRYIQENGEVLVRSVGQRLFDQKKELKLREWKDEAHREIKRQPRKSASSRGRKRRPPPDNKPSNPKGGKWNPAWGPKPEDVEGPRQDGRYGHGNMPWGK